MFISGMRNKWFWAIVAFVAVTVFVGFRYTNAINTKRSAVSLDNHGKVTYYFDPLCGWCYAFSSVIDSLQKVHGDKVEFEVVPGGMVVGSKVGPVSNISKFLLNAIPGVEKMTGVKFGAPFINNLKEGSMVFNSTPPSLAVVAFKKVQPKNQVAFAAAVQKAIYYEGGEPQNIGIYSSLASKYGEDSLAFEDVLKSPPLLMEVQQSYKQSQEAGVNGFPTVIYSKDDYEEVLTRGYCDYNTIQKRLSRHLK